jgi:hypothetical protein
MDLQAPVRRTWNGPRFMIVKTVGHDHGAGYQNKNSPQRF